MPTNEAMNSGLCCVARHANAIPSWKCDCPCHQIVEEKERPANEIDELHARIDEKFKYNLLRANYLILAQAYHMSCKIAGAPHTTDSFQECIHLTCQELVRTVELTRI